MKNCKLIELTRIMVDTPKGAGYLQDINRLLKQLSSRNKKMNMETLLAVLDSPADAVFACVTLDDHRIVGMVRIHLKATFYGRVCEINDLVVHKSFRRQGIARRLLREVESTASLKQADYYEWTRHPRRVGAEAFYKTMGYHSQPTTSYWIKA